MTRPVQRSPSYLSRNKYSYYFRIRVPDDMRSYFVQKELRYSLKTGYLGTAKPKAMLMAGLCLNLFDTLRKDENVMKLSRQEIQVIVNKAIRAFLEYTEAHRLVGAKELDFSQNQKELSDLSDSMGVGLPSPGDTRFSLAALFSKATQLTQQSLKEADYTKYERTVQTLIKLNKLDIEKGSIEFMQLSREFLKAYNKWSGVEAKRDQGDYSDDVEVMFPVPNDNGPKGQAPLNTNGHEGDIETLGTILDEYWKRRIGGWGAAAVESYERYKSRLLEHFGNDKPISAISYKDMEAFRDELKEKGNRGKPVSVKTVNLHLEFYSGVFNHAIQSGRILHSPVNGLKLSDKRNQQELNDPFTQGDLTKLFHCKEYKEDLLDTGWKFWLPPLLLYTGARLEELCQLYVDDIKTIDGIWVLDIDATRPDQKVKTHEKRYVPLHPFLTDDLGLIEFTRRLPDPDGRLFPDLIPIGQRKRYGHYPSSNWFPRFKKKCGIKAPKGKKTIHSFRHNVAACLMEQDVQEYVIAMMLGHKHAQISTGRYGKKYEPAMLMEKAVMKLDYPVDLSHLKNSKWARTG